MYLVISKTQKALKFLVSTPLFSSASHRGPKYVSRKSLRQNRKKKIITQSSVVLFSSSVKDIGSGRP